VAGAFDFDFVAFGSCGIPPFEVGLMALSFVGTNIQLGLILHAGVVMTALKLAAALSTWDRAMKAACSVDRSAAKYS
jgi:hypothetical protein